MERTVAIGIQDFETIRKNNCFYVDKTALIKEWWESRDATTLITRPRRFGKTLNMSMLEQFFSLRYADRGDLFEGLSIWQEKEYRKLQGTWPVISLSFAGVKEQEFITAEKKIRELLKEQFKQHAGVMEDAVFSEEERLEYRRMARHMEEQDVTMALYRLSEVLFHYYGKKVIILLDEYDTPMQEAWLAGYWEESVYLMRSLFLTTFKVNPYLERAVMTGITRVSKESMFSDLNHLNVATITSDEYATSFGFTEEEVFAALEEYGLGDRKEIVKRWYDGFTIGTYTDIYNPWSIINYLDKRKLGNYWANTSSNRLAGKLVREGEKGIKEDFETLLQGGMIQCSVDEQIVYNRLTGRGESIWSLLLAGGYLKAVEVEDAESAEEEGRRPIYTLALTNTEVLSVFRDLVREWFDHAHGDYNDFIKALLLKDLDAMNEYMSRISLELFSSFDTGGQAGGKAQPEKFYHGFVLGLMVDMQKDYILTSNRESGFGRYDVMLEPRDKGKDAFLLEFKVHHPRREKNLEETVEAAHAQIRERKYAAELVKRGIKEENIHVYGFAFEGKKVLIG